MNAIRLILLILLIWILWWFVRRWFQNFQQNQKKTSTIQQHGMMVQCDYCGLYLPEKEALHSGNAHYCCEAHEQATRQS